MEEVIKTNLLDEREFLCQGTSCSGILILLLQVCLPSFLPVI